MSLVGRILRPTRIPPLPTIVTQVVHGPWPACPWRRCRWSWWPPVLRRRQKFPGKITGPLITWWYGKLVLDGAIITKMKDSTNNLLGNGLEKKPQAFIAIMDHNRPFPDFPTSNGSSDRSGVVSFNSALNAFSFQNSWSLLSGCHGFVELTQTEVLMESQQPKNRTIPWEFVGYDYVREVKPGPCVTFVKYIMRNSFEIQQKDSIHVFLDVFWCWTTLKWSPTKNRFMFCEVSSLPTVAQWSWAGAKYHHLQHRLMWWVFFSRSCRSKGSPKYVQSDFLFMVVLFFGLDLSRYHF